MGTEFNLSYIFNLGSLIGIILGLQILTGLFLCFYYEPRIKMAYDSVQHIINEVFIGWLIRLIHFNGASFFFVTLYLHFFKALFYNSYRLKEVWFIGLLIIILLIIEAFLGYSLVWGQISFWAATVITSLLGVIPLFGKNIINFIWGGFNLNSNTIKTFFLIHFITPLVIRLLSFYHILFLHKYGRTSELGFTTTLTKRSFYPFYWFKDLINLVLFLFGLIFILIYPFKLGDPLVFEELNELVSPVHIVPEWYFLWAYAILRAVPSKVLGVISMLSALLVFILFIFNNNYYPRKRVVNKFILVNFIFCCFFLTWLGGLEPLPPYVDLRLNITITYFFYILVLLVLNYLK